MDKPLPFILMLLIAATTLAGCLGGDDTQLERDDGDPAQDATLGTIKGRILTSGLDAVSGARVQLVQGSDLVAETDTEGNGNYEIRGIEPGEYRIQVSAPCCRENARALKISEGETVQVDLQLNPFTQADLKEPFVDELEWNGFLACGVGSALVVTAPCGVEGADPNDDFLHEWELHEGVEDVVIGMHWEPAGGIMGEELFIAVENLGCGINDCDQSYARVEGTSPLLFKINNPGGEFSFKEIGEEPREMQFRVFPAFSPNVYYQQPFTVHYHVFYHQKASDDYNPIPDL